MAIAIAGQLIDHRDVYLPLGTIDERLEYSGARGAGVSYYAFRQILYCAKLLLLQDGLIDVNECTVAMTGLDPSFNSDITDTSLGYQSFSLRNGTINMRNGLTFFARQGRIVFGGSFPVKDGDGIRGDFTNRIFSCASVTSVSFNMGAESLGSPINFTGVVFGTGIVPQFIPGKQFAGVVFGGGTTVQGGTQYNFRVVRVLVRASATTVFWQCDHAGWIGVGSSGSNAFQAINVNPDVGYNQVFLLVNPQNLPDTMSFGNRRGAGSGTSRIVVYIMQAWNPKVIDGTTLLKVIDAKLLNTGSSKVILRKSEVFDNGAFVETDLGGGSFLTSSDGSEGVLIVNHKQEQMSSNSAVASSSVSTSISNVDFNLFSFTHNTYGDDGNVMDVHSRSDGCGQLNGEFLISNDFALEVNRLAVNSYEDSVVISHNPTLDDFVSRVSRVCYDSHLIYRNVEVNELSQVEFRVPFTLSSITSSFIEGFSNIDSTSSLSLVVSEFRKGDRFTHIAGVSISISGSKMLCDMTSDNISIASRRVTVPEANRVTDNELSSIQVNGVINVRAPVGAAVGDDAYVVLHNVATSAGLTINKHADIGVLFVLGTESGLGVIFGNGVEAEPSTVLISGSGVAHRSIAVIDVNTRELLFYRAEELSDVWAMPVFVVTGNIVVEVISRRPGYPSSESSPANVSDGGVFIFSVTEAQRVENVDGVGGSLFTMSTSTMLNVISNGVGSRFVDLTGSAEGGAISLQTIFDETQMFSASREGIAHPIPCFYSRQTTGAQELLMNGYTIRSIGSTNIVTITGGSVGGVVAGVDVVLQNDLGFGDVIFVSGDSSSAEVSIGFNLEDIVSGVWNRMISSADTVEGSVGRLLADNINAPVADGVAQSTTAATQATAANVAASASVTQATLAVTEIGRVDAKVDVTVANSAIAATQSTDSAIQARRAANRGGIL